MKAKIFVGPSRSGKTRVANMIAEFIDKEKTAFICARKFNRHLSEIPFLLAGIPDNTELLIIDDCLEDFDFSFFFPVQDDRPYGGDLKFIVVRENPQEYPKEILIPKIIFTTEKLNEKWTNYGASFNARFDIVEFPLSQPGL